MLMHEKTCVIPIIEHPDLVVSNLLKGLFYHFFFFLFDLILYIPVNNLSVMPEWVFLGRTSSKLGHNTGEAQTHNPSVSSQALYH